jgi:hypothetical protein
VTGTDAPAAFQSIYQRVRALCQSLGTPRKESSDENLLFDATRMHLVAPGPNVGRVLVQPGAPTRNCAVYVAAAAAKNSIVTLTPGAFELSLDWCRAHGTGGGGAVLIAVAPTTDADPCQSGKTVVTPGKLIYSLGTTDAPDPTFVIAKGLQDGTVFPSNDGGLGHGSAIVFPADNGATGSALGGWLISDVFPRIPVGFRLMVCNMAATQDLSVDLVVHEVGVGIAPAQQF